MMNPLYQKHLARQMTPSELLFLDLLIEVLQNIKQVKLEIMATAIPLPILFDSRRKKIQRFLSISNLDLKSLWFPIIQDWLSENFAVSETLYIAIDRTNWDDLNLMMVSLIYQGRALPLYFELLPKLGSSNFSEQQRVLSPVLDLLKTYKTVVLGDREKKPYRQVTVKEAWYILTSLEDKNAAIAAYKKRFNIEEMFRDFKGGGYNLEETKVRGKRLESLILITCFAYFQGTLIGQKINKKRVSKYLGRIKETGRITRRHSYFYLGLYCCDWVPLINKCWETVEQLMKLSPGKLPNYLRGMRAMELIVSTF